jgi:hypothetical protein
MAAHGIEIAVETGDALTWPADVLALKYAQSSYGVDEAVLAKFKAKGVDLSEQLPRPSEFYLTPSQGVVNAATVLFVGVAPLHQFDYKEIRQFGRRVLTALGSNAPESKHLALTIHGPGYGLDELEAFESMVAGMLDAVRTGDIPNRLERLTIVERNTARALRLSEALSLLVPDGHIRLPSMATSQAIGEEVTERLRSAGYASSSKPHIFVAMPFATEMDDVFHYGIQGAVNAAGFLCERADLSTFTGDVMAWVRDRIESASLIIADLTDANPNVYLEVGFAWGRGRPTVLLVRNPTELKFDVKGQRCLVYKSIRDLEERLRGELANLRDLPR